MKQSVIGVNIYIYRGIYIYIYSHVGIHIYLVVHMRMCMEKGGENRVKLNDPHESSLERACAWQRHAYV